MEKGPGKRKQLANNEEGFKAWLAVRKTRKGDRLLMPQTQRAYLNALKRSEEMFGEKYAPYGSIFAIDDPKELATIVDRIKADTDAYGDYNIQSRRCFSSALKAYLEFLQSKNNCNY